MQRETVECRMDYITASSTHVLSHALSFVKGTLLPVLCTVLGELGEMAGLALSWKMVGMMARQ